MALSLLRHRAKTGSVLNHAKTDHCRSAGRRLRDACGGERAGAKERRARLRRRDRRHLDVRQRVSPTFGGRVGIGLTPSRAGRRRGRTPGRASSRRRSTSSTWRSASACRPSTAKGASAWIASPRSSVRPYGEATAGVRAPERRGRGSDGGSNRGYRQPRWISDRHHPADRSASAAASCCRPGRRRSTSAIATSRSSPATPLAATLNEGHNYHVNQVRVGGRRAVLDGTCSFRL